MGWITDKAQLRNLIRSYEEIINALDDEFSRDIYHIAEIRRRSQALQDFENEFYAKYNR